MNARAVVSLYETRGEPQHALDARPSTSRSQSKAVEGSLTLHVKTHLGALESTLGDAPLKPSRPRTPAQWPGHNIMSLSGTRGYADQRDRERGRNAVGVTSSSSWGSSLRFGHKKSKDSLSDDQHQQDSSGTRRFPQFIRKKSSSISGHGEPTADTRTAPSAFVHPTASGPSRLKKSSGGHSSSNSGSSNGSYNIPIQTPPAPLSPVEDEGKKAIKPPLVVSASSVFPSMIPGTTFTLTIAPRPSVASTSTNAASSGLAPSTSSSFARPLKANPVGRRSISLYEASPSEATLNARATAIRSQGQRVKTKQSLNDLLSARSSPPTADQKTVGVGSAPLITLNRPHPYALADSPHVNDQPSASNNTRPKNSLFEAESVPTTSASTSISHLRAQQQVVSAPRAKIPVPIPHTKTMTVARTPCTYDVTSTRPPRKRSSSLPLGAELIKSMVETSEGPTEPEKKDVSHPPLAYSAATAARLAEQSSSSTRSASPAAALPTAIIPAALARARARTLVVTQETKSTKSDDLQVVSPQMDKSTTQDATNRAGSSGTSAIMVATPAPGTASLAGEAVNNEDGNPVRVPEAGKSGLKTSVSMPDVLSHSTSSPAPTSLAHTEMTTRIATIYSRIDYGQTSASSTRTHKGGGQKSSIAEPSSGTLSLAASTSTPTPLATVASPSGNPQRAQNRYAAVYRAPLPVDAHGRVRTNQPKPALSLSMPSGRSIIESLNSDATTGSKTSHFNHAATGVVSGAESLTAAHTKASNPSHSESPSPFSTSPYSGSPVSGRRPPPRAQIPESPTGSPERSTCALPTLSSSSKSPASKTPLSASQQPVSRIPPSTPRASPRSGVTANYGPKPIEASTKTLAQSPISHIQRTPIDGLTVQEKIASRPVYVPPPSSSAPPEPRRRPSLPIPSMISELSEADEAQLWGYFERSGLTSSARSPALPRSRSATVATSPNASLAPAPTPTLTVGNGARAMNLVTVPGSREAAATNANRVSSAQDAMYARIGALMVGSTPLHTPMTPNSSASSYTPPLTGGISPTSPFTLDRIVVAGAPRKLEPGVSTLSVPSISSVPQQQQQLSPSTSNPTRLRMPSREDGKGGQTLVLAEPGRARHIPKALNLAPHGTGRPIRHMASRSAAAALPSPTEASQFTTTTTPSNSLRPPPITAGRKSPSTSHNTLAVHDEWKHATQGVSPPPSAFFHSPFASPGFSSLGVTLPTSPVTPNTPWMNDRDGDADSFILPPSPNVVTVTFADSSL